MRGYFQGKPVNLLPKTPFLLKKTRMEKGHCSGHCKHQLKKEKQLRIQLIVDLFSFVLILVVNQFSHHKGVNLQTIRCCKAAFRSYMIRLFEGSWNTLNEGELEMAEFTYEMTRVKHLCHRATRTASTFFPCTSSVPSPFFCNEKLWR